MKKFYTIIFIAIVSFIISGSALQKAEKQPRAVTSQNITPMEGWKTYTDSIYSFKINYPPHVTKINIEGPLDEETKQKRIQHGTLSNRQKYCLRSVTFGTEVFPHYWISVHQIPPEITLEDFIAGFKFYSKTEINWSWREINELECLVAQYESNVGGGGPATEVFLQKGNLLFVLYLNSSERKRLEEIITSFRF